MPSDVAFDSLLSSILDEYKISLASNPVWDPESQKRVSLFVRITINSKGHQRPSKYTFSKAAEKLLEHKLEARFILLDDRGADIASTVSTALSLQFPGTINNVFVSNERDRRIIWVEPRTNDIESVQNDILRTIHSLLSFAKTDNYQIDFTTNASLPSGSAILATIRTFAPLGAEELLIRIRDRGFEVPNLGWLKKRIDQLRKAGRIVYLPTRQEFVLTLDGLKLLGTRRSSTSPDIARALAIARRKN